MSSGTGVSCGTVGLTPRLAPGWARYSYQKEATQKHKSRWGDVDMGCGGRQVEGADKCRHGVQTLVLCISVKPGLLSPGSGKQLAAEIRQQGPVVARAGIRAVCAIARGWEQLRGSIEVAKSSGPVAIDFLAAVRTVI